MLDSSIPSDFPRRRGALATVVLTIIVCILPLGQSVRAENASVDFPFDINSIEDTLAVWVDLSGLLQAAIIERIEDGIDQAFECRMELARPKRLFGSVRIAERTDAWRLSYRILTERWLLTQLGGDSSTDRSFGSLAGLAGFLSDSIVVGLVALDSLERDRGYTLKLDITSISLAGISLTPNPGDSTDGSSVLRSLFSEFLKFTGYGREEYSIESRQFTREEIVHGR
ncbi:DUF4390 domain-containing protein [bacterium]|nr:DUF4390 domain-containing protein [bacterium]